MFTSKGWGQSRPQSSVEGHSPQPRPAAPLRPPLPPRDPAAGRPGPAWGRKPLGREAACSGKAGGAATKIKGRRGSGAPCPPGPPCPPCLFPLVTHPDRRALVACPNSMRRQLQGRGRVPKPGMAPPQPPPGTGAVAGAGPGRPPRSSLCPPPSRETRRRPAQAFKITARGTTPARGFVFPLEYKSRK